MRVDQPAHSTDERDSGVRRRGLGRPAAATGTEARLLGRLRYREERDLSAPRPPAGTRGTAIDPRRLHRIDERAVIAAIARQHDAPATLGRQVGSDSGTAHAGELSALPYRHLSGSDCRISSRSRPGPRVATASFCREAGPRPATGYIQGSSADGP